MQIIPPIYKIEVMEVEWSKSLAISKQNVEQPSNIPNIILLFIFLFYNVLLRKMWMIDNVKR